MKCDSPLNSTLQAAFLLLVKQHTKGAALLRRRSHQARETHQVDGVHGGGGCGWGQVRLVEEDTSYITYGATYESYCQRYVREADLPIALFKKRCFPPTGIHDTQTRYEVPLPSLPVRAPMIAV